MDGQTDAYTQSHILSLSLLFLPTLSPLEVATAATFSPRTQEAEAEAEAEAGGSL